MIYLSKETLIKVVADKALSYLDIDSTSTYMISAALQELGLNIDYLDIDDCIDDAMRSS